MKYFAAVIALYFVFTASITAKAQPAGRWDVAGWQIQAYRDPQTGAFSHCAAGVPYQGGISMMFALNRSFDWSLAFANDRWALHRGEPMAVSYAIDARPPMQASALVIGPTIVEMPLPDSAAVFTTFREGQHLALYAHGDTLRFPLANAAKALAALLDCAKGQVAGSPRPQEPFPSLRARGGDARSETTMIVATMRAD